MKKTVSVVLVVLVVLALYFGFRKVSQQDKVSKTDDAAAVSRAQDILAKNSANGSSGTAHAGQTPSAASDMTYEQALERVDAITEQTDSTDVYAIFSALKADVIANPDHSNVLVTKILDTKERDGGSKRKLSAIFGALAQSQSPAIANQLADLATQCPDNFCKVQAIVGLNDHPHPNEANAQKMLDLARTNSDTAIAGTALLAAGSMGKKLGDAMPGLAKDLITEMANPGKGETKSAILAAMGNHGSVEYFPTLENNLKAKETNLRAAAAYSLRYLPNPEATSALVGVVQKDVDDNVKREAIKALQYKNLTETQYGEVAETSATLPNKDVQQSAARLLIGAFRDNPKNAETALKTLRDQTKFKDVKDFIESELNAPVATPGTPP